MQTTAQRGAALDSSHALQGIRNETAVTHNVSKMTIRLTVICLSAIFFSVALYAEAPNAGGAAGNAGGRKPSELTPGEAIKQKIIRVGKQDGWTRAPKDPQDDDKTIRWVKTVSPVTGHVLELPLPNTVADPSGGIDADFCVHTPGQTVVHSRVWMCLKSGYATTIDNFSKKLPPDLAQDISRKYGPKIRKELNKLIQMRVKSEDMQKTLNEYLVTMKLTDVPDWIKYRYALEINAAYRNRKGFPALGFTDSWRLVYEASHAYRRAFCEPVTNSVIMNTPEMAKTFRNVSSDIINPEFIGTLRGLDMARVISSNLNKSPEMLLAILNAILDQAKNPKPGDRNNPISPINRMTDMYAYAFFLKMAALYDRIGKPEMTRKSLINARKSIPRGLAPKKGISELFDQLDKEIDHRLALFEMEQDAMTQSEEMLTELIRSGKSGSVDDLPFICYLIGEQMRRIGLTAGSKKWLAAAAAIVDPKKPLAAMTIGAPTEDDLDEAGEKFVREIKRMAFTGVIKPIDVDKYATPEPAKPNGHGTAAVGHAGNVDASAANGDALSLEAVINQLYSAAKAYYDATGKLPDSLDALKNGTYLPKTGIAGCMIAGSSITHAASGGAFVYDKTVQLGNPGTFFLLPKPDSKVDAVVNGAGRIER